MFLSNPVRCYPLSKTLLFLLFTFPTSAQEHVTDSDTLLLVHANNTLTGNAGETASATNVDFQAGIFAQGAALGTDATINYEAQDNIHSAQGTLEFWFKPSWPGNDGNNHWVLQWGGAGGILIGKDGGNYWRMIVNRFGTGGQPERGAGINVGSSWQALEWHHCAFTWNSDALQVFIDGALVADETVGFTLPAISSSSFQLGADGTGGFAEGIIDEIRISSSVRTSVEIADSYLRGLEIIDLAINAEETEVLATWRLFTTVTATTLEGQYVLPNETLSWTSNNTAIASVDTSGLITAHAPGNATITADYNGIQNSYLLTVVAPVLAPVEEILDPALTIAAPNAVYQMPVMILRYLPTTDGINVDSATTNWTSSLAELQQRTDTFNYRVKYMLEEGSRFRDYGRGQERSALGYRVVRMVTVYEPIPKGTPLSATENYPDYEQILDRFDTQHWVEELGVKEVWLWGYHHDGIVPAESRMSSPLTGDISNSLHFDDLPIYNKSFVIYNYNFTRSQAEAVHNHGHQLEQILQYANVQQDGNSDLFWQEFVGRNASGQFVTGRSGWTHMPPNTTTDYDYQNTTLIASDIMDWQPQGGAQSIVSSQTWGNTPYQYPDGNSNVTQLTESNWYIYWLQSMPGLKNTVSYAGSSQIMTNWWRFTARWDESIAAGIGLHTNIVDSDGDSVLDNHDNCLLTANPQQIDSDQDNLGNACDGDFNNDCTVNFIDIAAFADAFLGSDLQFDLTGDGQVNFIDFSILASQFLQTPGPGGIDGCQIPVVYP